MRTGRLPWAIAGTACVAVAALLIVTSSSGGRRHPNPRPGITAEGVLASASFAGYDRIVRSYEAARQMPEVLEGLYCYCDCRHHFNHRSLLTCFQSEHGASCDICLDEAWMAAEMHRHGKSLAEIRHAADAQFGS